MNRATQAARIRQAKPQEARELGEIACAAKARMRPQLRLAMDSEQARRA
jgi:hypothetical protein